VRDEFFHRVAQEWLGKGWIARWTKASRKLKGTASETSELFYPVGGANALAQKVYQQVETQAKFLFNHHIPINSITQLPGGKVQISFAPQPDGKSTPAIQTDVCVITTPGTNLLSPPANTVSPQYNPCLCLLVSYQASKSEFPDAILEADGSIAKIVSQRARGLLKDGQGEELVVFFSEAFSTKHLKDGYSQELLQKMWQETQAVFKLAKADDWLDPIEYVIKRWEHATVSKGITLTKACQVLKLPNGATIIFAGDGYASTNDYSTYSGVERAILSGMSAADAILS